MRCLLHRGKSPQTILIESTSIFVMNCPSSGGVLSRMFSVIRFVSTSLFAAMLLVPPCAQPVRRIRAKPIRLVVPFPPGGSLDVVARAIGQKLTDAWGQPVIIDNRPGAGGNIGADLVAKSAPDGYTILEGALSTHAVNVSLYGKLPYDPIKDFAPISLVAITPNVLVINPTAPFSTVPELIAYAKANPGKLSFGSGSNGSAGHLAGELFKTDAHVDMVHIPYKGGAPALQALLAGDTQLMFDNLANSMQQVRAGKLKAVAVTTAKRSTLVPELPDPFRNRAAGLRHLYLVGVHGARRARPRKSSPSGIPRSRAS